MEKSLGGIQCFLLHLFQKFVWPGQNLINDFEKLCYHYFPLLDVFSGRGNGKVCRRDKVKKYLKWNVVKVTGLIFLYNCEGGMSENRVKITIFPSHFIYGENSRVKTSPRELCPFAPLLKGDAQKCQKSHWNWRLELPTWVTKKRNLIFSRQINNFPHQSVSLPFPFIQKSGVDSYSILQFVFRGVNRIRTSAFLQ